MKERMKDILAKARHYNPGDVAEATFGLSAQVHYDALVVAPGWKPTKLLAQTGHEVRVLGVHSYISSYEILMGEKRVAWIQCASGACNLIDHLLVCAGLDYDKLIFVGAVGGLSVNFPVGTLCTPSVSISGSMAEAYLLEDPTTWKPFQEVRPSDPAFVEKVCALADVPVKKGRVFCTDSIFCEYDHLGFIRGFDVELIEMETAVFYRLADLLEKPAVALLVVSDNSASGEPLLCRQEEQVRQYNYGRKVLMPRLLEKIVNS